MGSSDLMLASSKASYRSIFIWQVKKDIHSFWYCGGMKLGWIFHPLCLSRASFCRWTESRSAKSLWTSTSPTPTFSCSGWWSSTSKCPAWTVSKASFFMCDDWSFSPDQCHRYPNAIWTILDLDKSWSSMSIFNKCPTRLTIRRCIMR